MICLDRSAMKLSFSVLAGLLLQVVPVAGQDFVWARQMGGTGFPQSSGVALDGSGNTGQADFCFVDEDMKFRSFVVDLL